MEELKSYYAKQKEAKEKALLELQISLSSFEEKTAAEKRFYENEIDTLKDALVSARDEGEVLLTLVDASRIEADKAFKQAEILTKETLEKEKALAKAEHTLEELEKHVAALTLDHHALQEIASRRLKELNTLRVQFYQSQLLAENYQNQVERARAYFKAQRNELPPSKPPEAKTPLLQTLEKDKGTIKQAYDQMFKDYHLLKSTLDKGKSPTSLVEELKEKKQKLEQTKSELVGIEREIFIIKKGLQEKGSYAS
jgi:acyl transferase domain-containing protein